VRDIFPDCWIFNFDLLTRKRISRKDVSQEAIYLPTWDLSLAVRAISTNSTYDPHKSVTPHPQRPVVRIPLLTSPARELFRLFSGFSSRKRSAGGALAMRQRVTPLQIWYTANELAVKRSHIQAGIKTEREREREREREESRIDICNSQGVSLPRREPQFVMRDRWVPCHEPEGRDCVIRWWGPFMRANVPPRRSRKVQVKVTVCWSRRRRSGMMNLVISSHRTMWKRTSRSHLIWTSVATLGQPKRWALTTHRFKLEIMSHWRQSWCQFAKVREKLRVIAEDTSRAWRESVGKGGGGWCEKVRER
jgi:hypothetical protein